MENSNTLQATNRGQPGRLAMLLSALLSSFMAIESFSFAPGISILQLRNTRPRNRELYSNRQPPRGLAPLSVHRRKSASYGGEVTKSDNKNALSDSTNVMMPFMLLLLGSIGAVSLSILATHAENFMDVAKAFFHSVQNFDVQGALVAVNERVQDLGPLGYAYFALAYIGLEVLALPAFPLTASAGYLFGTASGTLVVIFSATIAASISFQLARTFLRKYIESLAAGNETFQAIDEAVGREGFQVVLLLRLSPMLPFALSNYLYGLTKVAFVPYVAATAIGFTPGTLIYVYMGNSAKALAAGVESWGLNGGPIPWYAYAGIAIFLLAVSKVVSDVANAALAIKRDA